jgi:hypothetical protein
MPGGKVKIMDRSFVESYLKAGKFSPATASRFENAVALLREEFAQQVQEWESTYGEPFPIAIEDWKRWLARIDAPGRYLPAEKAASGHWTGADILPAIEGYLQRLRDQTAVVPQQPTTAGRLSPRELADKHGVRLQALNKRLERWRYEHDAGYYEVSNPKKNEPHYVYDETAVMPVIDDLKARSAVAKRPTNVQRKKI